MTKCSVCNSPVATLEEHHIVPRSRGGIGGPTVMLCGSCHDVVHMAARAMLVGRSYDELLVHYDHDARKRAEALVRVIAISDSFGGSNPNPEINFKLDDPKYLVALALYQRDRGFSSREKMMNAIIRNIAIKYGLVTEEKTPTRLVSLDDILRRKEGDS